MPTNRNAVLRHIVPPDNPTGECNEWCLPLHQFHERIMNHPHAVFFDPNDFMLMSVVERVGHPLLVLWKHYHTRWYLNLDADGGVWQYVAPRKYSKRTPGTYRRVASDEAALEHLELEMMPWMDLERFGHLRTDPAPW